MKILFLVGSFYRDRMGGLEYRAWSLAKELASRGYDIYFLMDWYKERKNYKIDNISAIKIPCLGADEKNISIEYKSIMQQGFDLVINFNYDTLKIAQGITNELNIPFIWCVTHLNECKPFINYIFSINSLKYFIKHWNNYKAIRSIKWIVCQTQDQENLLIINKATHKQTQISIIPNGHVVPNFNEKDIEKLENCVIWIGNLNSYKRPHLYFQIANDLKNEDIEFNMIGRMPTLWRLKTALNLLLKVSSKNLHYFGECSLEKTNEILSKQKLLVCTSKAEGFPNTFIQAWMRGIPVVSLFDPDNLIKKNNLGYCSTKIKDIKNSIRDLSKNDEKRLSIGLHCRDFALKYLSLEKMADNYEVLIRQFLH